MNIKNELNTTTELTNRPDEAFFTGLGQNAEIVTEHEARGAGQISHIQT